MGQVTPLFSVTNWQRANILALKVKLKLIYNGLRLKINNYCGSMFFSRSEIMREKNKGRREWKSKISSPFFFLVWRVACLFRSFCNRGHMHCRGSDRCGHVARAGLRLLHSSHIRDPLLMERNWTSQIALKSLKLENVFASFRKYRSKANGFVLDWKNVSEVYLGIGKKFIKKSSGGLSNVWDSLHSS